MGYTINERPTKNGDTHYRLALRLNGGHLFSLTFVSREAAFKWVKEHEKRFYVNPMEFHTWKQNFYLLMREKGLMVLDGIVRPKYHL